MHFLYLFTLLFIGLTSCTSYQYVSLKSDLDQTTLSKHYYYQDDKVYVDFDFSGANFPTNIYLENIGSKPLYLDLERTLFLENDVILRNAIPGNTGYISTFLEYEGQINGITTPEGKPNIILIPAGEKLSMVYDVFGFTYNKTLKMKSTSKTESVEGYKYRLKSVDLSKNVAPTYEIAFYFYTDTTFSGGYDVIAQFWPEKVYSRNSKPSEFPISNPNLFHTSQRNKDAQVLGYLALLGISLTAIILTPDEVEE